jgi:hypothetical protein
VAIQEQTCEILLRRLLFRGSMRINETALDKGLLGIDYSRAPFRLCGIDARAHMTFFLSRTVASPGLENTLAGDCLINVSCPRPVWACRRPQHGLGDPK